MAVPGQEPSSPGARARLLPEDTAGGGVGLAGAEGPPDQRDKPVATQWRRGGALEGPPTVASGFSQLKTGSDWGSVPLRTPSSAHLHVPPCLPPCQGPNCGNGRSACVHSHLYVCASFNRIRMRGEGALPWKASNACISFLLTLEGLLSHRRVAASSLLAL